MISLRLSSGRGEAVRTGRPVMWRVSGRALQQQVRAVLLRQHHVLAVLLRELLGPDSRAPRARIPQAAGQRRRRPPTHRPISLVLVSDVRRGIAWRSQFYVRRHCVYSLRWVHTAFMHVCCFQTKIRTCNITITRHSISQDIAIREHAALPQSADIVKHSRHALPREYASKLHANKI